MKLGSKRRRRHIRSKYKNAVSYVISVFVMLCITVSFWGVTIKTGLLNTGIVEKSLVSSGYYEEKAESLTANLKNMFKDSGISEDVSEGIITDRMIVLDTNNYISSTINNEAPEYDTEGLKTSLIEHINSYLASKGVTADDKLAEYVELLSDKAVADYESNIKFPFISYFMESVNNYKGAANMLIIIPIPLLLVCLIVLILMHRMKYRGIRYFGYGVCAASILEIITSLLMKRSFMSIAAGKEGAYFEFVGNYISGAMRQGIYSALAGFMIFGIIIIVTYYCRKKAI